MRWLVVWVWVAVAACGREASGPADASASESAAVVPEAVPVPEIMFAGCSEVGPKSCVRERATPKSIEPVVVWLDVQRHAHVRVTIDGEETSPHSESVDGGVSLVVAADADATKIEIKGVDPAWVSTWELELQPHHEPAFRARAMKRFVDGEPEQAIADVEAQLATLTGNDRLEALIWLAAATWAVTGKVAAERLHNVAALARKLDRTHQEARALAALIHADLLPRGELLEAQDLVERLEALGQRDDEARVWAAERRARLEELAGNRAAALRGYERTTRLAARLRVAATERQAWEALSALHMRLSRWPEVEEALEQIERLAEGPNIDCRSRLAALTAIGWRRLSQRIAGQDALWPDPEFEAALALAEPGGQCPSPDDEDNLRVNLALSHLHDGDAAGALDWLEPLGEVSENLKPWVREVRARAGMQLGRLEHVPSPLVVIDDPDPDDRWNALVRHAEFLATIGAHAAELEAWEQAEVLVNTSAAGLDISVGRERFVAGRRASAEGLVGALVEAGRVDEALCRARLARSRALRMLDLAAALDRTDTRARRAWMVERGRFVALRDSLRQEAAEDRKFSGAQRERRRARRIEAEADANLALDRAARALQRQRVESCDALAQGEDGLVRILVFPNGLEWLLFVADSEGVDVVRLTALPGESGRPFPGQVEERIARASRIQVLLTGDAWREPVATWRLGSGVLLDQAPLEYALDLAPRSLPPLESRAVVVADPSQDLVLARDEAREVVDRLQDKGWHVEHLSGRAASLDAFTEAVAGADILHYAGHGESRGDAGWQAALLLAEDARLEVTDILALRSVPSQVVLTGCETGNPDAATLEGGMSLGRAFVLAGAHAALVADGKVADWVARAVGERVYAGIATTTWDLADSLRVVQLELRDAKEAGWAHFRVVVP